MKIRSIDTDDSRVWEFINRAFTDFATKKDIELNYEDYCFIAETDDGTIAGAITGRAYYNEVHIGDLIVDEHYRGQDIGTHLVRAVEQAYGNGKYEKITLTTFGFQAPEFYKKLGYSLEFIREDKDPKLSKYFFCKYI